MFWNGFKEESSFEQVCRDGQEFIRLSRVTIHEASDSLSFKALFFLACPPHSISPFTFLLALLLTSV
jgi:hypothetical protein